MKCKNCGTEFEEGLFCPNCGSKAEEEQTTAVSSNAPVAPKKKKKHILRNIILLIVASYVLVIIIGILTDDDAQTASSQAVVASNEGNVVNGNDVISQKAYSELKKTDKKYFTYSKLNETEIAITGYDANGPVDVVIPQTIDKYNVVLVRENAFSNNKKIKSIALPGTIDYISSESFANCTSLEKIILDEGVDSIGAMAFSGCTSLTQIIFPDSLSTIYAGAFENCTTLKKIVSGNNLKSIGEDAFCGCNALQEIVFSDSIISIEARAFKGATSLLNVELPQNLESLGENVFFDTGITKLAFPTTIENIGDCNVQDITIPVSKNPHIGNLEGCQKLTLSGTTVYAIAALSGNSTINTVVLESGISTIAEGAFYNFTGLKQIDIPDSVTVIEKSAFENCTALDDVTLPKGLSKIAEKAFKNCTSLTSISISDNVMSIEDYAFENSSNLDGFNLPKNLKELGNDVFAGCPKIHSLFIPNTITYMGICDVKDLSVPGQQANILYLDGCENLTIRGSSWSKDGVIRYGETDENASVYYDASTHTMYQDSFDGLSLNNSIKKIVMEEGIQTISDQGFAYFTGLEEVVIPSTLTTLGTHAFEGCKNLKTIYLPNGSLKKISESSFKDCSSLTSIDIPVNVVSIGKKAFCGCSKLVNVNIINGVTEISERAFDSCKSLQSISLGESIKKLGDYAFFDCQALSEIEGMDHVEYIGVQCFFNTCSLNEISFGDGLKVINQEAFLNSSIKSMIIPRGIQEIGNEAISCATEITICLNIDINNDNFNRCEKLILLEGTTEIPADFMSYCSNLRSVTIPEGVITIYARAFRDCKYLTDIQLPESLIEIKQESFANTGIEELVIPKNVKKIGPGAFKNVKKLIVSAGCECSAFPLSGCTSVILEGPSELPDFSYTPKLQDLVIGEGLTEIREKAFYYLDLKTVTLPDSLTKIGTQAFCNCKHLKEIRLPEGLEYIGEYAFEKCYALSEITIPEGITEISESAFIYCTGLKSVVLPDTLKRIAQGAFNNCSSLVEINIPNSLEYVGWASFKGTKLDDSTHDQLYKLAEKYRSPFDSVVFVTH